MAARHIMRKEDDAIAGTDGEMAEAWETANAAFHGALVAACGSRWLLRIRAGLLDLCERYRRMAAFQELGTRPLREEHDAIAAAVLARDAEAACTLTTAHYRLTPVVIENSTRAAGAPPDARLREP